MPEPTPHRARAGLHVSISGGLPRAAERARERGCESVQIFCGNPRGWSLSERDADEVGEFRAALDQAGLWPLFVHACYLVNPCAPDDEVQRRTVRRLRSEAGLSARLGAAGYVLHPGSAKDRPAEWCIERAAGTLRESLLDAEQAPRLLLENTASEHGPGGRLRWLARLAEAVEDVVETGVCLDTCHLFAAGYDLRTESGAAELAAEVDDTVGRDSVRLMHVNDAKDPCGSGRDRHEHIGRGLIGRQGLRNALLHPALRGTPAVLETPWVSPEVDRGNLEAVRNILRSA